MMMAAVLAALMTCSAFTPAVAVKADDDVVKLKIWVFGEGSTEECEKVSEALSEITREKIGAEVEIYQTIDTEKLNLAMTSGEKLDLVCAHNLDRSGLVSSGMLLPLDELYTEYAPDAAAMVKEEDTKALYFDDQMYFLPSNGDKARASGVMMRKDILDELGINADDIKGMDDFHDVLVKVKENYPDVPMMLCSGGGARCDYEALKYFTEFWCSDNTDPVERAYIQWGFSQFFPAKAMCAHVTSWNKNTSIKFRTDMASMCKLGFDIGLKEMAAEELEYCQLAVANWKRLQPVILDGIQYRLVSPYESNHMAVNYVSQDASKGVVFAYDIYPRFQEKLIPLKVKGLDPNKMYRVKEINLMPGTESTLEADGELFSGDYLMKVGLDVFGFRPTQSHVIELTAE